MPDVTYDLDMLLRALADPTRRDLFVRIARRPGQSTTDLAGATSGMTRWGVMKHLDVLRSAGLIQTLTSGRERRHYHEPMALEPLAQWLAAALAEPG